MIRQPRAAPWAKSWTTGPTETRQRTDKGALDRQIFVSVQCRQSVGLLSGLKVPGQGAYTLTTGRAAKAPRSRR